MPSFSFSKLVNRNKTQRHPPIPEISQNNFDTLQSGVNNHANRLRSGIPVTDSTNRRATYNFTQNPDPFRGPAELQTPSGDMTGGLPRLGRHDSGGYSMDEDWNMVSRRPVASRPAPVAPPPPYVQGCGHIHEWSRYTKGEINMIESQQNCSTDVVRRLRELIRERYALDIELWAKRDTHRANYPMIMPKCKKADEILQEIYWIVNSWDEKSFTDEEWDMIEKIRACLRTKQTENEPAYWQSLPPWARDQSERNR